MAAKQTFREKVDKPAEPQRVQIPDTMHKRFGSGSMIIATPKLIEYLIQDIPERQIILVSQLMDHLAQAFQTNTTCPMTTGIFLNLVAKATEEDRANGHTNLVPYWRVLKTKGELNPKYPGGMENQADKLREEGHEIDDSRKVWRVVDYEEVIFPTLKTIPEDYLKQVIDK
jgi:hypothetical protein